MSNEYKLNRYNKSNYTFNKKKYNKHTHTRTYKKINKKTSNNLLKDGGGIGFSKPDNNSKYLSNSELSTKRPQILVGNSNIVQVTGEEKYKRLMPLAKRIRNVRERSLMNKLMGKYPQEPKKNERGNIKSHFSLNNQVGFKA